MEPEMNTQNWNDNYQTQNQTNPCEQPQILCSKRQWLQQTWFNVKVTTWLTGLVIVVILTIAAVSIAPKSSSADSQEQNSTSYLGHPEVEDDWYDYDYDY